jgi:hypothetical protein
LSFVNSQFSFFFTSKVFLRPTNPKDVYLRGPGFENMYALTNQGQCRFSGVTKGGKVEFKRLVALCVAARAEKHTHTFEKFFLKEYQAQNGIIAATAEENKKAKRRKTNDEIAEESDDEDEYSLAQESESSSNEQEEEQDASEIDDDVEQESGDDAGSNQDQEDDQE